MISTLIKFWFRRFAVIFVIAALTLALIEWLQQGARANYLGVLMWSGLSAIVATSIATYWSYRRACAVPGARD